MYVCMYVFIYCRYFNIRPKCILYGYMEPLGYVRESLQHPGNAMQSLRSSLEASMARAFRVQGLDLSGRLRAFRV